MSIIKRSVKISGHASSVTLEKEFWQCLKDIAVAKNCSINTLISDIDQKKDAANLSSAIRLYVLKHFINLCENNDN